MSCANQATLIEKIGNYSICEYISGYAEVRNGFMIKYSDVYGNGYVSDDYCFYDLDYVKQMAEWLTKVDIMEARGKVFQFKKNYYHGDYGECIEGELVLCYMVKRYSLNVWSANFLRADGRQVYLTLRDCFEYLELTDKKVVFM